MTAVRSSRVVRHDVLGDPLQHRVHPGTRGRVVAQHLPAPMTSRSTPRRRSESGRRRPRRTSALPRTHSVAEPLAHLRVLEQFDLRALDLALLLGIGAQSVAPARATGCRRPRRRSCSSCRATGRRGTTAAAVNPLANTRSSTHSGTHSGDSSASRSRNARRFSSRNLHQALERGGEHRLVLAGVAHRIEHAARAAAPRRVRAVACRRTPRPRRATRCRAGRPPARRSRC